MTLKTNEKPIKFIEKRFIEEIHILFIKKIDDKLYYYN